MKRLVISILVIIAATTIIILAIPTTIYNYYAYTLPMKDPLIDYGGSDFHYLPIGKDLNFFTIKNIILLDDKTINVEFKPDSHHINYDGINFAYFKNINVGETFVVSCQYLDHGNKTLQTFPSYEELRKADEESIIVIYDADEEYFKNNCDDGFSDSVTSDELCKHLYADFLRNETVHLSQTYGYKKLYLDKEFYDKPAVNILKYMGPGDRNGVPVAGFHHVYGYLRDNVSCDYPQVIEHSINLVELDIPDWYICAFSDYFRPTLVLDKFRGSDMCAEYE